MVQLEEVIWAIEASPGDVFKWDYLAQMLPRGAGGEVEISGEKYTRAACSRKALLLALDLRETQAADSPITDLHVSSLWNSLGAAFLSNADTIQLREGEEPVNRMFCHKAALELCSDGDSWMNLAQALREGGPGASVAFKPFGYELPEVFTSVDAARKFLEICLEPGDAAPWFLLASYLPDDGPISFVRGGVAMSLGRIELLLKAIYENPNHGRSWELLAVLLHSNESVELISVGEGGSAEGDGPKRTLYSKRDCVCRALGLGRSGPLLWYHAVVAAEQGPLTVALPSGQSASITQSVACISVIELGAGHASSSGMFQLMALDAYKTLALNMSREGTDVVHINNRPLTVAQLYIAALELNPKFGLAWCNLGVCLDPDGPQTTASTASVSGEKVDRLVCYIKAVENWMGVPDLVNPKDWAQAWVNLAGMVKEGVTVNAKNYTACGCVVEALRITPKSVNAFTSLANILKESGDKGQDPSSPQQMELAAILDLFPVAGDAGNGNKTTGEEPRVVLPIDCHKAAVISDPTSVVAWHNCAYYMAAEETVTFDAFSTGETKTYTKIDCFVEAIRCDDKDLRSWQHLANTMLVTGAGAESGTFVEINGKQMSQADVQKVATLLSPSQRLFSTFFANTGNLGVPSSSSTPPTRSNKRPSFTKKKVTTRK